MKPGRYVLRGNEVLAVAVNGGDAILQHLGIVIVQNLYNISECADQQYLIQMGCLATAVMAVPMATLPYRIIVGGGMPILPPIAVATVSAEDLISKQGEGRTVPIRMLQPILDFRENHFGYNARMAVLDEIAG